MKNKYSRNPWTTLSNEIKYENPWIKLSHRNVLNPKGGKGVYGVVDFKNVAVGVMVLDEAYNTWLVGQYRYPLEQYSWEIPEGGAPLNELPLEAAKRELLEETGITASKWSHLLDIHTSNSVTSEVGVCYLAQDLSFGAAAPEETEELELKKLPFAEAYQMVLNNQITDAISIAAILKTNALLKIV